jgi:hypothetical protein
MPALYDPRQAIEVRFDYDVRRGYRKMHYESAIGFDDGGLDRPARMDRLDRRGWDVVEVMTEKSARDISRHKPDAAQMGKATVRDVLEQVFGGVVTERIRRRLWCDFAPISVHIERTDSSVKPGPSQHWHFDSGPTEHLKLLVHLGKTDGATALLDRHLSDLFIRTGYGYCLSDYRVKHIDDLGGRVGIDVRRSNIGIVGPLPGHGILFEPAVVMHKGILPTSGERLVLQILIVPYVCPWRDAWEAIWPVIEGNDAAGFPVVEAA